MKNLFLLLILIVGSPVLAYYVTDSTDGGVYNITSTHVVAPNGDTYVRMGNRTYTPDNVYRREGEYTYGNDGSIYRHHNNFAIQIAPGSDNLRLYTQK